MVPYKCPDCGDWWAGFSHRCDQAKFVTTSTLVLYPIWHPILNPAGRCSCPHYRGDNYLGTCPIHDTKVIV